MDITALTIQGQRIPAERNPALVYLAGLTTDSGRRGMASALRTVARMLEADVDGLDWRRVGFQHMALIRSTMIGAGYAPATTNKTLAALRGVARAAWQLGYIDAEARAKIQDVRNVKGHTVPAGRALTQGELLALANACAGDRSPAGARDAAMIGLAYACGLRRSELVGLDFEDLTPTDGVIRLTVSGKGHKERFAYAVNGALTALQAWLDVRGEDPGALFWPVNKAGRVIVGQRLTAQAFYNALQKRAAQANVQALTPHDLRRSFVGDLLDKGVDIATVQGLAGHANVTTTARYDRRPESVKRQAVKALHWPWQRKG